MMFLAVGFMLSCDKTEAVNIDGDSTNRVFLHVGNNTVNNYNGYNFLIEHTPIGPVGEVKANFPIRSTQPTASDVKVQYQVDHSLIQAYNQANKTDFVKLPEGILTISANELVIPKGQTTSSEALELAIPTAKLPELTAPAYLIPFKITNVTGDNNTVISSNQNTIYLVVRNNTTNLYNNTAVASMTGTLVTPRTGWSATLDVPVTSGALANLFDARTNTNFVVSPPRVSNLTVNLGTVRNNISGIRIHTSSTANALTSVRVLTSVDGINWTSQGISAPALTAYQYLKFYAPVNAAQIRLEILGWRSATQILLTEFDLYAL